MARFPWLKTLLSLCALSLDTHAPSIVSADADAADATAMEWTSRSPCPISGVHHPITFANETHGFLLTGSTYDADATSTFYLYDESTDTWTDLTDTAAFPGAPRSFGYGVVLDEKDSTKAYLGFGASNTGERLADLWEFDMVTMGWRQLPSCPDGHGRRHPAMVAVRSSSSGGDGNNEKSSWEIHVGLGDTYTNSDGFINLNDFWSFDIATETWERLPDLPSSPRHHPFYFGIGSTTYAGLGHSRFGIERDFFSWSNDNPKSNGAWAQETSFASYDVSYMFNDNGVASLSSAPVTTEARVAGTQFSIGPLGFVLSGDGDDHGTMFTGEFHAFYPAGNDLMSGPDGPSASWWRRLPPHPGFSRWAPGSFVMRGSTRAYFVGGYDRYYGILHNDLYSIDLAPLFPASTLEDSANEETGNMDSMDGGGSNEWLKDALSMVLQPKDVKEDSSISDGRGVEAGKKDEDREMQEFDIGKIIASCGAEIGGVSSCIVASEEPACEGFDPMSLLGDAGAAMQVQTCEEANTMLCSTLVGCCDQAIADVTACAAKAVKPDDLDCTFDVTCTPVAAPTAASTEPPPTGNTTSGASIFANGFLAVFLSLVGAMCVF